MELMIGKLGDHMEQELMDYDVSDYFPFIIKTVCDVTGRYVEVENSIELSIALEKFMEIQKHYRPAKGPFIPYAKKSIRNAIIDYMKSEKSKRTSRLDESYDTPSNDGNVYDAAQLSIYEKELKVYGITFSALADKAPVHKLTRIKLVNLARKLYLDKEVMQHLKSKKRLPITVICNQYDMTTKVIKTHKIYIIAIVTAYAESIEPVIKWIDEQV